jgi:hypothetical protein
VEEHRAVGGRDAVAERPAVGGVGNAAAAAVGLDQLGQHPGDAGKGQRERRGMVGAVRVDQHLGVALGQPVAALGRREGHVVAGEIAGGRLLLEPFPGVPGRDAGPPGDLDLGRFLQLGHGPVEAELDAEKHAEGLHRPGQPVDQPPGEQLTRVHIGRGRHVHLLCHGPVAGPLTGSLVPVADSPRTARVQGCDDAPVIGQPTEIELGILGALEVRVDGRPSRCRERASGRC